jgi:hypothetical protein
MVPAELAPRLRVLSRERIGARPCESWYVQIPTLGGFLGDCRDTEDLQRIEAAWSALATDIGPTPPEPELGAFPAELDAFKSWDEEMRDGMSYTTWPEDIAAFDSWTARAQAWRFVFARVRGVEPSGPAVVPPAPQSAGLGGFLADAKGLLLLGLGAWVLVSLVKRT